MKRIFAILCLAVILSGCSGNNDELDKAMTLRAKMIAAEISFDAKVTADYGDKSYTFTLECKADTQGDMTFAVKDPASIAGIQGKISVTGGKLIFDDTALAFELMADGQISPISAPWLLIKTLRSGYLTSCCREGELLRLSIDDSYEDDALHLDIWLAGDDTPTTAEIYWQGRRLLTVQVENFHIM